MLCTGTLKSEHLYCRLCLRNYHLVYVCVTTTPVNFGFGNGSTMHIDRADSFKLPQLLNIFCAERLLSEII